MRKVVMRHAAVLRERSACPSESQFIGEDKHVVPFGKPWRGAGALSIASAP